VRLTVAVRVKLPDVPVIVTVTVPVVAVPLAASVSVLVAVAGLGLNDAVTPLARPDAEKLTLPLKPFCGVIVIVLVLLVPCAMPKMPGDAERVKLGAAVTVREIVVGFARMPDMPVIVTVTVPVVAVPLAVSVSVLVAVAGLGLNDAVTPLGRPDADKVTLSLKPFCGATVIVLVPLVPCTMLKLPGDAERVKFGFGSPVGQLLTRFVALTVPIPVAKSQPIVVPYAGLNESLEVESTPCVPGPEGL
jgi:hypothetical protein